ncbi:MAG TPA: YetF domain-containing protein [Pseudolabrys sp.]|nr:YetF domain-containing protein [Pseudolabrys sp.]
MHAVSNFFDAVLGLSVTRAEQLSVFQVCVRAFVVYVVLIAYVRFGKKRFLSSATAFDAILVIVIGSVSSRAISGNAPFVASLAAALVLILVHWIISYFTEDSKSLGNLLKGRDTLIIKNGVVDRQGMRKTHMSEDDLAEDLRQQGVKHPIDVEEARLERSGKLSVIKKK